MGKNVGRYTIRPMDPKMWILKLVCFLFPISVIYIIHLGKLSKKSPTGPTERTPKPEYLVALATYLGVRW